MIHGLLNLQVKGNEGVTVYPVGCKHIICLLGHLPGRRGRQYHLRPGFQCLRPRIDDRGRINHHIYVIWLRNS